MAALSRNCPHCATKRANFEILHEYRPPALQDQIHAFVSCGVCGKAAVAVFRVKQGDGRTLRLNFPLEPGEFRPLKFHPRSKVPEVPEHLPENVREYYLEAVETMKTQPNAAGAMFRKTLDVGLKAIAPDARGTLYSRIEALAEAGTITKELAEWSHHIRVEGNDASHEEEPFTRDQAEQLHRFTELVMMYLFTLPGMLGEWRPKEAGDPDTGD